MSRHFSLKVAQPKNRAVLWIATVILATGTVVSGCTKAPTQDASQREVSTQFADELLKSGDKEKAADQYARIGEILFRPNTLSESQAMIARAVELNPGLKRAKFMSVLSDLLASMRGMFAIASNVRGPFDVHQWYRPSNFSPENYRYMLCFDSQADADVKSWYCDLAPGQKVVSTYHEWNRHLRTVILPAFQRAYQKLLAMHSELESEDGAIEIFGDYRWLGIPFQGTYIPRCEFWTTDGLGIRCTIDPTQGPSFSVDSADLKVLSGAVGAVISGLQLQTAYSWEGFEEIVAFYYREVEGQRGFRMSHQAYGNDAEIMFERIRKEKNFLVLENDHQLSQLSEQIDTIGKNLVALHAMRDELCRSMERLQSNALFKQICTLSSMNQDDFESEVLTSLGYLKGPGKFVIGKDEMSQDVVTTIDLSRIVFDSPKDLKRLLPTHFDRKGRVAKFEDKTLGGLFPNGDLVNKINAVKSTPSWYFDAIYGGRLPVQTEMYRRY